MPEDLTPLDHVRIERAVWSLDQRLYDLPRKTRIARRRELRDNLRAAGRDLGVAAALDGVGATDALAAEYLEAELGPSPRPSWVRGGIFLLTATLVLTSLLHDAANAFGDGILTGDPGAQGTFTWEGIAYLQDDVTYTVAGGNHEFVGGAFTPLTYALLLGGAIVLGRLWGAIPRRGRAVAQAS